MTPLDGLVSFNCCGGVDKSTSRPGERNIVNKLFRGLVNGPRFVTATAEEEEEEVPSAAAAAPVETAAGE